MRMLFAFLSVVLLAFPASAKKTYKYMFAKDDEPRMWAYLDKLSRMPTDNWENLPSSERESCEDLYQPMIKDGVLKINLAVGYMDLSAADTKVIADGYIYGYNPSYDFALWSMVTKAIVAPCRGNLRFCGFTPNNSEGTVYTKNVRIGGESVLARIEIRSSSITELWSYNTGKFKKEQTERTALLNNYFAENLKGAADVTIYDGHSRNGGGPDFAPPVLKSGTHLLDYGYYTKNKPGLKKMINALTSADKTTSILALLSCKSYRHFNQKVFKAAPEIGLFSTTALTDMLPIESPGIMDAVLRGQCRKSFHHAMTLGSGLVRMDNVFKKK